MQIITNGRLITRDPAAPYFEKGAVAYEGTKIVAVGEETKLRAQYPDAKIIDAKGGVIMPAFINAHTHIYSALARGLSIVGNNPTNFYEVLDGTWWAIDRKLTLEGTMASADALYMDCIKHTLEPGEKIRVMPGNSITLEPYLYHRFYAEKGKGLLIVGEVSRVNDDNNDNVFYAKSDRFSKIEEDEAAIHPLVNEY